VAPTGTTSIIADTSGGAEPLFGLAYRRAHTLGGEPLVELNPIFRRHAHTRGLDGQQLEAVLATGNLETAPGVPESMRRLFVTAPEIPPRQHLLIQHAFQRHVDNAVSKTISLPGAARREDGAEVYRAAWRLGLKGVTVYRYGSKTPQVLQLGAGEDPAGRELFAKCDPGACRL
jgi:ribonucleoside-diphosphate reductase alpha chain